MPRKKVASQKPATPAKPASTSLSEVLTVPEAAALLKCSVSSLNRWRIYGAGPRFVKIEGCVRYRVGDLRAYLETRTRTSTAAVAA